MRGCFTANLISCVSVFCVCTHIILAYLDVANQHFFGTYTTLVYHICELNFNNIFLIRKFKLKKKPKKNVKHRIPTTTTKITPAAENIGKTSTNFSHNILCLYTASGEPTSRNYQCVPVPVDWGNHCKLLLKFQSKHYERLPQSVLLLLLLLVLTGVVCVPVSIVWCF